MMISDERTKNIALMENLVDAGCSEEEIKQFLEMNRQGNRSGQLQFLASHRKILLESVHSNEKKISCLDFLTCKIRNSNKEDKLSAINQLSSTLPTRRGS